MRLKVTIRDPMIAQFDLELPAGDIDLEALLGSHIGSTLGSFEIPPLPLPSLDSSGPEVSIPQMAPESELPAIDGIRPLRHAKNSNRIGTAMLEIPNFLLAELPPMETKRGRRIRTVERLDSRTELPHHFVSNAIANPAPTTRSPPPPNAAVRLPYYAMLILTFLTFLKVLTQSILLKIDFKKPSSFPGSTIPSRLVEAWGRSFYLNREHLVAAGT
jgi:hypothetical protein